jgi:hypothetical protein
MDSIDGMREFTPELVSRRGEFLAWAATFLVSLAWIILSQADQPVPFSVPLMAFILLLVSLSMSFSNWMDRQTSICLRESSITFRNGLRNLHFKWDEIQQVQEFPSNWGNKVRVIGNQAQFQFRTLGEVKFLGEVKGMMGFSEGKFILEQIITKANLKITSHHNRENTTQKGTVYYYERQ